MSSTVASLTSFLKESKEIKKETISEEEVIKSKAFYENKNKSLRERLFIMSSIYSLPTQIG